VTKRPNKIGGVCYRSGIHPISDWRAFIPGRQLSANSGPHNRGSVRQAEGWQIACLLDAEVEENLAHPNRRPQRVHNLEANTGLQLSLSMLRERRRRLPRKTRFRLAGCASTGRESNPLGRFERFQVTSILLSRTSPVARFVYAKPPFAGPEAVLAYLARYTHRVAISNSRLVSLDKRGVTFRYKITAATAGRGLAP
jgi:hypothetical protein